MASWNFGTSRGGPDPAGLLDLKALLNQVTGGSLGTSLGVGVGVGGLSSAVGSGNRGLGGLGGIGSNRLGSSGYGSHGNPAGVIGSKIGLGLDGGSSGCGGGNNESYFDPFSSMSTFGFFNAKEPSSASSTTNGTSIGMCGGGMNKSPTGYGGQGQHGHGGTSPIFGNSSHSPVNFFGSSSSNTNNSHHSGGYGGGNGQGQGQGQGRTSPIFGGNSSHSPVNFFGSSSSSSSHHNNYNNSNSEEFTGPKFPISTFSIADTIPGRERERREAQNQQSCGTGSDDMPTTNGAFPNISHFGSSSTSTYRERDSFGNSNNHQSHHNNNRNSEQQGDNFNQGVRETGIIEKLLHSYGFIQCCERQARLFFHFSQFDGTIEHLKLGDPVEFEMTYDRRTGKPIASAVTKIGPEVVLSEERVQGTVTTELHHESSGELQGRISYENRGECFFLPYCQEDIEGNVTLSVGDTVSFQIATNQRSGNLTARYVRLENPARPVRYRGIVGSLKDNFGYIERQDVAKEIFFQFSETRITDSITVNDNVEFNIQTRNVLSETGKEVATTITKLPFGTVMFEDIGTETLKGQILKPIDKSQCPSPVLGPVPRSEQAEGRLRYRGPDRQELEVLFREKDQQGTFTMRHGDWVQFQLAIDRRNKQQRATNVILLEESFAVSGERREEGVVSALKGDCGYITCAERDQKIYFRFSELLDFNREPKIADDMEFTIVQDPTSPMRQSAIRIKYLKHGSVQFEISVSQGLHGVVSKEPSTPWLSQEALAGILPSLSNLGLPSNVTERLIQSLSSQEVLAQLTGTNGGDQQGEPGVIQIDFNSSQSKANGMKEIQFHWKDCKHLQNIRVGTKIIFDIHQVRKNREYVAANIRADVTCPSSESPTALLQHLERATVEVVKGQYGFLSYELEDGKKLFFHMSEVKDNQHLNPGDEVEFVILQNPRNGKSSACSVIKVGESQRPERLLNRLSKLSVDESAPRLVVVRQPFGPDGTKGFAQPRLPRKAGVLNVSRDSTSSSGSQ